jgi:hypothetical protein
MHRDDGESSTNARRTMTATSPLSCKHKRATHDDGDVARDGPSTRTRRNRRIATTVNCRSSIVDDFVEPDMTRGASTAWRDEGASTTW